MQDQAANPIGVTGLLNCNPEAVIQSEMIFYFSYCCYKNYLYKVKLQVNLSVPTRINPSVGSGSVVLGMFNYNLENNTTFLKLKNKLCLQR